MTDTARPRTTGSNPEHLKCKSPLASSEKALFLLSPFGERIKPKIPPEAGVSGHRSPQSFNLLFCLEPKTYRRCSMKFKTALVLAVFLAGVCFIGSSSAAEPRVLEILGQADSWIIQDTARILGYIDSCNNVANDVLMSSKNWQSTYDDLSFLLGIDLATDTRVDNTGRYYFLLRITGQVQALFYVDSHMEFPHQLTPNNWADMGINIGYYYPHPSGKYVLVGIHQYGNENFDIYKFDRDGKFQPLLADPAIQFRSLVFKNEDEFFCVSNDRKTQTLIKYTTSTGKIDTLYTEPGWFSVSDYQDGKLSLVRWLSFSESQLFVLDEQTKKPQDISKVGLYWGGVFTKDGKVLTYCNALSTEKEFAKFALIDLKKPKKLNLVYDPKLEIDDYAWMPEIGIAVCAANKDGYSEFLAWHSTCTATRWRWLSRRSGWSSTCLPTITEMWFSATAPLVCLPLLITSVWGGTKSSSWFR
jgi:hypothetical protein